MSSSPSSLDLNFDAVPGDDELVSGADKHIVLIPSPSEDPDDPLNWTKRRKWIAVTCTLLLTAGIGAPQAAIYYALPYVAMERHVTQTYINNKTGYIFLFYGIGAMFFNPLALQIGKRPVYLFCMLATCLLCVWPPYSNVKGEWIGCKIVQGFFGAAVECLPQLTMADLFFEHERSLGMALYGGTLMFVSYGVQVLSGFITSGQGWEWVMWWCAIWGACVFVILLFFMEETSYDRHCQDGMCHQDKYEKVLEKDPDVTMKCNAVATEEISHLAFSKVTFWQKMSLTRGAKRKFLLHHYWLLPLKMAQFPVVLWSGFLYACISIFLNVMNATEVDILAAPPYNFGPSLTGLVYVSPLICSMILFLVSGYLSDWIKIKWARYRGGKSIAEDRLWVLSIFCILGTAFFLLWGIGAYQKIHWFPLVLSLGIVDGCGVAGPVFSSSYVVDSYREFGAEAIALVILIRDLLEFAVSFGQTIWFLSLDWRRAFISVAVCFFVTIGSFLLVIIFGPKMRRWNRRSYWKIVERGRELGLH